MLRKANIKKIIASLQDFFVQEVGISENLDDIDVDAIAKLQDPNALINLTEFVLGAAIECENKREYIQNIMLLDEESQGHLMIIIERVYTCLSFSLSEQRINKKTLFSASQGTSRGKTIFASRSQIIPWYSILCTFPLLKLIPFV